MALFETWLKSDLKKPLKVEQLKGNLFSSDSGGNQIGVEVLDNGSPATLTGGVMGYVIRADGATVAVNGSLSGNRASIVLPGSAYVVTGQVSIAIKVGSTTVGACSAYVYRTTTDSLVDPGHVIPSIEELLAKIADCEAATTAAESAASSANTAASTANTAATGADTAAGSANTAAGSANTAASTANAAAQKIDGMTVAASRLPSGSSPTATVSEVSGHKHIAFGIPNGDTGETPDFAIGEVETLLPGEKAYVELDESSTPEEPVLNFGIPQGNPGSITDAFASNIAMSPTDPTTIKEAVDEKMDEPETAGTDGQVLTSDGEGGQVWKDMSLDKYHEASGNIVHVEDAVAEPVKSLEIEIAPVQDLHGYDHPWVGGAGKNLCDKDDENIRVKLYVEASTGKAKSSASLNQPYRSVLLPCKPSTAYTVSNTKDIIIRIASFTDVPSDNTSATEKNAPSSATTAGTGLTITTGASDAYILVQALENADVTGGETTETALAGLMVEEGSTAHAWEPYANICPISGWTGCNVTRTGTNDIPNGTNTENGYVSGKYLKSDGTTGNASDNFVSEYFIVNANETYTMYSENSVLNNASVCFYDASKTFISGEAYAQTRKTITVPSNAVYARATQCFSASYDYAHFEREDVYAVTFPAFGKNLFGDAIEQGTYRVADGVKGDNTKRVRAANGTVLQSGTYTISCTGAEKCNIFFYDVDDVYIGVYDESELQSLPLTFTLDSARKVKIIFAYNSNAAITPSDVSNIQLEAGSSATSYEPFNNTVYGGTLNVTTGVLTVNKIGIDLGSEEWTYDSQYTRFASGDHTDIKYTKARELPGICSCYPVISDGRDIAQVPDKSIYGGRKSTSATAARKLYIKDSSFESDASALATAMQGQIFVCEMETAAVYQLTPTEIRTLLGENYIYADTGDILDLVYSINNYALTEDLEAGLNKKVDKNQGTENTGKTLGINEQGMVEPVTLPDFTGATSSTAGVPGNVPAPAAGDQDKVLMGDGTWSDGLPEAVESVKSSLALVENGDTATQNIAKGKYVLWKGVMCRAASAISSGDTLSSTNLTEVSGGGLNDLPAFEDVSKCIFRGNLYNTHDANNLDDGIYYIASTLPAHAPTGYNWSVLYQVTVADTMIHQYVFKPVSCEILMREYSGNPAAWGDWRSATGYGVSWSTNFTAYLPNNVALICVNSYIRIQVFLGGTTDVNVTVENIGSSGITSFIKTGSNSVTFGDTSASGTDYTITRNGKFITVTRGSNAAMICKC